MATTAITVDQLTNACDTSEGTGVFDVLFKTVSTRLHDEYVKGRLAGPQYSEVLLGSIQTVLQQSLQFLLSKDKITAELALLDLQKQTITIQNDKLKLEKDILTQEKELNIIKKQAAEIEKQLLELQVVTVGKQNALIDSQVLSETQKRLNMVQEALQITAQTTLINQQKDNLLIEKEKIEFESLLVEAQKDNVVAGIPLNNSQKLRIDAETNLIGAKLVSETAQTSGVPGGLLGKQMALYQAQIDGFAKDASQKAAKVAGDIWAVARTTDPDATQMPITLAEIKTLIMNAA
jgi:hypothetical protein